MKYGVVLPYGDAHAAADLAAEAEQVGWDGFFVWEPVWGIDPWVALTAAAMATRRIRLGTLLTPLSRRRPWKLAGETATLDRLSGGRVILSVGLGALDSGFAAFGEVTDRKTRAELLDEGLDILTGLWAGQPFNYAGRHYKVQQTTFYPPPPPTQQPRIPIWVVGAWPSKRSMQRALRYDGLLPSVLKHDGTSRTVQSASLDEFHEIMTYVRANRAGAGPFDIIVEGQTPGGGSKAAGIVAPWAEAGATWWIEAMWDAMDEPAKVRERVEQGPPRNP
jgi:alkanesulfonate monooxygenase SsuD/methylene tetrahydromethanopterin reductase-like flavin-dependent oxidoreductase (luciferase family)